LYINSLNCLQKNLVIAIQRQIIENLQYNPLFLKLMTEYANINIEEFPTTS